MPNIIPEPLFREDNRKRHNPIVDNGIVATDNYNLLLKVGNKVPADAVARALLNHRLRGLRNLKAIDIGEFSSTYINTPAKVGGDPEFFILDKKDNLVPSFNWLGVASDSHDMLAPESTLTYNHTNMQRVTLNTLSKIKKDPNYRVLKHTTNPNQNPNVLDFNLSTRSWLHPDGYQIEFGYFPVRCMESTAGIIRSLFSKSSSIMNTDGLKLSTAASIEINPAIHGEVELGCRPSFNAWDDDNTITDLTPTSRFGGGHFHFGMYERLLVAGTKDVLYDGDVVEEFNRQSGLSAMFDDERTELINPVVQVLDWTLGLVSTALASGHDDPARREHHYGMAGDYRLTPYTLEYRVPSNYVWTNPVYWHLCGMIGRHVVNMFFNPIYRANCSFNFLLKLLEQDSSPVRSAINRTDGGAACELLNKHKIVDHFLCNGSMPNNPNVIKLINGHKLIRPGNNISAAWGSQATVSSLSSASLE